MIIAAGDYRDLTTGEKTKYTWNHRHQLTKITEKDDLGNVTKIVEYAYDPLGRRISKHIDNNGDGDTLDAGDDVDLFFYDGQHIALKTDESGNAENRYLHGPAIDMILADEDATGEVLWAAADHPHYRSPVLWCVALSLHAPYVVGSAFFGSPLSK